MHLPGPFSMATLDRAVMVVLIAHMWVLSLYGTVQDELWVQLATGGLLSFYTAEMAGRLKASGSFKRSVQKCSTLSPTVAHNCSCSA